MWQPDGASEANNYGLYFGKDRLVFSLSELNMNLVALPRSWFSDCMRQNVSFFRSLRAYFARRTRIAAMKSLVWTHEAVLYCQPHPGGGSETFSLLQIFFNAFKQKKKTFSKMKTCSTCYEMYYDVL